VRVWSVAQLTFQHVYYQQTLIIFVFASELWVAELETVAAQYAALGPIGADPGP